MKKIVDYLNIFSISGMVGYITLIFTIITTIAGVLPRNKPIMVLTCAAGTISVSLLIWLLYREKHKSHTLQILARDNRVGTLRMLLTYDYFRTTSQDASNDFLISKLHASKAEYNFKAIPVDGENQVRDLRCTYKFTLENPSPPTRFDVLILQARGTAARTIRYRCNDNSFVQTKPREFNFKDITSRDFHGVLMARLSFPEEITSFEVEFTLHKSHRSKQSGTIVICPFVYLEHLESFSVNIDYKDTDPNDRPYAIDLEVIPYDGHKGVSSGVSSLNENDGIWHLDIPAKDCRTYAAYFINSHHE